MTLGRVDESKRHAKQPILCCCTAALDFLVLHGRNLSCAAREKCNVVQLRLGEQRHRAARVEVDIQGAHTIDARSGLTAGRGPPRCSMACASIVICCCILQPKEVLVLTLMHC